MFSFGTYLKNCTYSKLKKWEKLKLLYVMNTNLNWYLLQWLFLCLLNIIQFGVENKLSCISNTQYNIHYRDRNWENYTSQIIKNHFFLNFIIYSYNLLKKYNVYGKY